MAEKLRSEISSFFSGEVFSNKQILEFYSVDASSYQLFPKLVVIPKNKEDVIRLVKFAKKKISTTVRGGGTGLVGSALGEGIILDLKNFCSIKVLKNSVIVGSGVLKGNLDVILKKHKKFFSPNPSVGPYCTIGGMIGTNAGGSRSLKYGSIIDNLLEVTIVTAEGRILTLPSDKKASKLIFDIAKKIDKRSYPKVTKNSCGYRLDAVTKQKEAHKVIAGSEGTLGIILSAKLKIYDLPPFRRLLILGYEDEKFIEKDCLEIVKLNPSAVEFVDGPTSLNIKETLPKNAKCLLFVEFDYNVKRSVSLLKNRIKGNLLFDLKNNKDIEKWWNYRDSALYFSLKNISTNERAPHIIEDATVPLSKLGELLKIINQIQKLSKTRTIVYGHAGNGNLHVRLITKNLDKGSIKNISTNYFNQVIKIGGSITGEHGDGLARSEFVKKQYGSKTYNQFLKIKKLFDPEFMLNPEKIISTQSTVVKDLFHSN